MPRLFQSLPASRETELAGDFPLHVVCEWMGNSAALASKHYLTVTDRGFKRAATPAPRPDGPGTAQKAAQQKAAQ